jgi:hypothetical protein
MPLRGVSVRIAMASLCAPAIVAAAVSPVTTSALVKTGDSVPGIAGATYSSFGTPAIGRVNLTAGDVAFSAVVSGGGTTAGNDEGIWKGGTLSPLALQAREGSAAGSTGLTYAAPFGQPGYGNDGTGDRLFFQSETNAGTGIWYQFNGTTTAVATTGQQAPGTAAGVVFGDGTGTAFPYRPLSSPNQFPGAAFLARLSGPGVDATNNVGIWAGTPGSASLSLRTGQQVSTTSGGVPPAGLLYNSFSNPVGFPTSFGVKGTVTGAGTTAANDSIVMLRSSSGAVMLGREGDYPFNSGLPFGNLVFGDLSNAVLTHSGNGVVWVAKLAGSAVNSSNDSVLWSHQTPIAREGNQAPGLPAGVLYGEFQRPYANGLSVGFTNIITGPGVTSANDKGLFARVTTNPFQLIAREGSQVPGLDPGITYADFPDFYMTEQGGIGTLFTIKAQLQGTGVDSTNDFALLQTLGDGSTAVIAREGFPLDIGGGVFRTVESFEWANVGSSSETGGTRILDFNRLTFLAHFTDGSSAVMVAVIPEPSTAALALLSTALLLRRRRRAER